MCPQAGHGPSLGQVPSINERLTAVSGCGWDVSRDMAEEVRVWHRAGEEASHDPAASDTAGGQGTSRVKNVPLPQSGKPLIPVHPFLEEKDQEKG